MNEIDLREQVAIITGGGQGFGLACAKRLVESGARVSLWNWDPSALSNALGLLGAGALSKHVDISDSEGLAAAHAEVEKEVGPVSILVNSAGIAGHNAPLDEYDLDEWRRVIEINLNGTFYVNRVVLPAMKARNYGRVVNISSVAGKEGNPNAAAYAASKAGVIGLVKAVGKEVAKYDIAINAITPAAANTRILEGLTKEFIAHMLRSRLPVLSRRARGDWRRIVHRCGSRQCRSRSGHPTMGEVPGSVPRLEVVTIGQAPVDLYGQQIGACLEGVSSFAVSAGECPCYTSTTPRASPSPPFNRTRRRSAPSPSSGSPRPPAYVTIARAVASASKL
ncbi:MAG: SDR family NAD(P)-dependent oxidoreductase [Devosia sp.]